ncbi:glycine zipper domain-containing protein [Sediminitomix flava]|uniref:Outer membrane protein with glycine zipper n=1 Tax=Sediminitomix flava TaxID=379075 RepID=A0A315Z7R3_SEDFL|nr:glycine zipper domain-containing protein [Sediminitomix flava]PWJ41002.1 outer membrane protein with glycine zipper [Sediminitomix flava]
MEFIKPFITSILMGLTLLSYAQNQNTEVNTGIAKSLGIYIFPSNNQSQETLNADEMACYHWAMEQTAYDPINPTKVAAQEVDSSKRKGSTIVGAAGGAATGAAIGAIAGDAGKGAAIGSVVGGLRGRRAKVVGDHVEQQQNIETAKAQEQELKDNFIKAFSACMEGKGYTVK